VLADKRHILKIWENYITELYDRANGPQNLETETEEKVEEYKKHPYIFHVEKVTKEG
jgi:hypothetical protein